MLILENCAVLVSGGVDSSVCAALLRAAVPAEQVPDFVRVDAENPHLILLLACARSLLYILTAVSCVRTKAVASPKH